MTPEKIRISITERLKEKNLSISKLERMAKISNAVLRNFLSGKTKTLTLDSLHSISSALGCSIAELMHKNFEHEEELMWNYELFDSILKQCTEFIKHKKIKIPSKKVLELANEMYIYSLKKNHTEIDSVFAEWYLSKNVNQYDLK